MRHLIVLLSFSIHSSFTFAATPLNSTTNQTLATADIIRWGSSLILVLAVFFLCVWLLRKTGSFTSITASQMRVISGLSLGTKERLVLIQLGDKQLLLGVSPGRIENLHTLEGDDCLQVNATQSTLTEDNLFAKKLMQVMQRNKCD